MFTRRPRKRRTGGRGWGAYFEVPPQLEFLSVSWSLQPGNGAATTCGRGRCELPVILRVTPGVAGGCDFWRPRCEKP